MKLIYNLETRMQLAEDVLALRHRLSLCGCSDSELIERLERYAQRLADNVAGHISVTDDGVKFKDPIE